MPSFRTGTEQNQFRFDENGNCSEGRSKLDLLREVVASTQLFFVIRRVGPAGHRW
jgi:hypothetical protein